MSLFGAQQSAPSLFSSQPAQSTSLFGAPGSSASLFGAPASSASLFGAPASSASLFATPAGSSSLFAAPASSASLFGAPAGSGSLFGAPASSAPLFGAPGSSAALFGAAASSGSLFAAPAQSGSLFGAPPQQQSLVQQQQQQPVEITSRTRISQLPQNFQTDLFAVERHLREQRNKASLLSSKRSDVETKVGQTRSSAESIARRLIKLNTDLEALQTNADVLKAAVRTERGSAEPVVIALENLTKEAESGFLDSNGLRYGYVEAAVARAAHVPEEYFDRILQEVEARAHEYKGEIDEIAEFLKSQGVTLGNTPGPFGSHRAARGSTGTGLLDSISQRHSDMGLSGVDANLEARGKTIEEVIRRQYDYFMVVASHVADIHETLRATKEQFLHVLRHRDPDGLNPFHQADLREKAERDRQRILGEKGLSGGAAGFGNTTQPAPGSSQPSLFQSQPSLFQSQPSLGGFGSTTGDFASSGAFGSTTFGSSGFGGTTNAATANGTNGSQAKRLSGGRRKRS